MVLLIAFSTGHVHSVEYTTLVNSTEMLEIAFHQDRAIINFLDRRGLISENTYDSVIDLQFYSLYPKKIASLLVEDIQLKVRLNPENYHILMRYFSENEWKYKEILNLLNNKYEELTQPPPRKYP